MDTPSDVKDTWKLSAQGALLLFFFVVIAFVGLCASAALRKKKIQMEQLRDGAEEVKVPIDSGSIGQQLDQSVSGWESMKKVLIGSLCWKEGSKSVELEGGNWQEKAEKTMEIPDGERWNGRESMATNSPLWQRRIMMGERCQMPRFSGLILYDEHGLPLQSCNSNKENHHQEKTAAVVTTTLRDLL